MAHPSLACLGPARVRLELADLTDDLVVVRIQREGAFDVKFGLVEVAPETMKCGEHAMDLGIGIVESVGALNGVEATLDQRRVGIEERFLVEGAGEPRVAKREGRVRAPLGRSAVVLATA